MRSTLKPLPRPAAATRARRYRIQALDRAAGILNCFEVGEPELNVRDIAERTGLHKSTAHRILMALQHNGFVEQDAVSGRYHLGLQLVKLGEHAVQRLDVRLIARPFLEELAIQTKETVHLAVMDGDQVVMLDRVEGSHALGAPSLPGRLFPAYCTSLGKAMLSGLEEAEVRRRLGNRPLKRYTPKTIRTVEALLEDLRGVRRRGFATADEELEVGLCTVAAAIRDRTGSHRGRRRRLRPLRPAAPPNLSAFLGERAEDGGPGLGAPRPRDPREPGRAQAARS